MAKPPEFRSILLDAMRRLLEEERSALLSGSPDQITAVTRRKLALADEIERECPSPAILPAERDAITELARYNRENAVICSAVLSHMTAALDKLRGHEPHRSYAADGSERPGASPQALGSA